MPGSTKHPLESLRPGFIDLAAIFGVDIAEGEFEAHPDFPNPKTEMRQEILESLACAMSPDVVDPILVFMHKDGKIVVLDGNHRLQNAIEKCNGDPMSQWAKIKVNRFLGTVEDAQVKAQVANLEFGRANLTEGEQAGVVAQLFKIGLSREQIIEKAGFGNTRWVKKIEDIILATPELIEAVKAGNVSAETGAKIARKVGVEDQSAALKTAEALEKKKGPTKARQDMGLRKTNVRILKHKNILENIYTLYENVQSGSKDDYINGQWEAYMCVLCINDLPLAEQIKKLEAGYKAYAEALAA